ncbi:hypothetical protein FAI41_04650 [Acetobacteraceae bacterium]|nr:hypothetical protein FAI41_04650 [Acetobacteraceae bacterium]
MQKITKYKGFFASIPLLCLLPLFTACEHDEGIQTHVFVPRVTLDETGACYKTQGIRMVRWANLIKSHREQKPAMEQLNLNKAQKNARIYSNIPKGFLEDKDPIYELAAGIQNIVSIPITAMIAATTLPSLKHERVRCLQKQKELNDSIETP